MTGLIIGGLLAGGVIGFLQATGQELHVDTVGFWIATIIAVLVMTASMAVGTVWMKAIDEAAQEAHKSAWYWGGSVGMAVGGVLVILATLPGAEDLALPSVLGRTDPAAYAAAGAFAMLTLMLIGYGVVWAWWWLSRTRG